jgi:hypothetical protein
MSAPEWLNKLWASLEALPAPDRIKVSGDIIVYMTQSLLPELATYRRVQVAELLEHEDWDPQKLAETIGARTVAINRLAKEGRQHGRTQDTDA